MRFTVALAGLIAVVLLLPSSATAKCAGPFTGFDSYKVPAGGKLTITGSGYTDGCHDVIINGYREPTLPARNIRILLVQGTHSEQIGTAEADKDFNLRVTVTIPPNTPPGEASIVVETPYNWKSRPAVIQVIAKDSAAPKDSEKK